jgi:hypothetical protein
MTTLIHLKNMIYDDENEYQDVLSGGGGDDDESAGINSETSKRIDSKQYLWLWVCGLKYQSQKHQMAPRKISAVSFCLQLTQCAVLFAFSMKSIIILCGEVLQNEIKCRCSMCIVIYKGFVARSNARARS